MTLHGLVVNVLASLTVVAGAGAVGILAALAAPAARNRFVTVFSDRAHDLIGSAWIVSVVATLGSLYFSAGAGFRPCHLCWYQRIGMYPLVLILGVGTLRADPGVWRYALPLPLAGLLVSAYHVVLQHRPTLDLIACEASNPCSLRYVSAFGFVSIPVMAGTAFVLIAGLLGALAFVCRSRTDVQGDRVLDAGTEEHDRDESVAGPQFLGRSTTNPEGTE